MMLAGRLRFFGVLLGALLGAALFVPGGAGADIVTPYDTIPDFAQNPTVRQVQDGSWSDPGTWDCNCVPPADAIAEVGAYDLEVDGTVEADTIAAREGGSVQLMDGATLKVANLLLHKASIQSETTSWTITGKDKPLDRTNDGVGVYDYYQYGTGLLCIDCVLGLRGDMIPQTFYRLAQEPRAGDTRITLADTPVNWKVGDKLVIPDTRTQRDQAGQWEFPTIVGINQEFVDLSAPLQFDHLGRGDFLPHVGNVSRTAVIRSENPAGTRWHVFITGRAQVDLSYVFLEQLGRTTTARLINDNQVGRYPVHMHHVFNPNAGADYQFKIVGVSADGCRKWCIALHDSHYGLVTKSVLYDGVGAAIATENGSEVGNDITDNFIVRNDGSGDDLMREGWRVDNGHEGSGIWMRAPCNTYTGNVVAGSDFAGFMSFSKNGNVGSALTVMVPKFKGADPLIAGQFVSFDARNCITPDFSDNEVYASARCFEWWYVRIAEVANLRCWNVRMKGLFNTYGAQMVVDGLEIVGDGATAGLIGIDSEHGQYLDMKNADVLGVGIGVQIEPNKRGMLVADSRIQGGIGVEITDLAVTLANPVRIERVVLDAAEPIRQPATPAWTCLWGVTNAQGVNCANDTYVLPFLVDLTDDNPNDAFNDPSFGGTVSGVARLTAVTTGVASSATSFKGNFRDLRTVKRNSPTSQTASWDTRTLPNMPLWVSMETTSGGLYGYAGGRVYVDNPPPEE